MGCECARAFFYRTAPGYSDPGEGDRKEFLNILTILSQFPVPSIHVLLTALLQCSGAFP